MTMRKRRDFAPNSSDWNVWHEFWSGFIEQFAQYTSSARAPTTGISGSMAGTVVVTIPYSTATVVDTTIWSTSIVTVPATTPGSNYTPTTTSSSLQETFSISLSSRSRASTISASRISPPPAISQPTASAWTALPSVITPTSEYGLPSVVTANPTADLSSSNNATANAMGSSNPDAQQQKRSAIVGGLSGTIAGLIFLGLLICLVLRLRRKKHDSDVSSLVEKAEPRPHFAQKLTGLVTVIPVSRAGRGSPRNSEIRPTSMSPVSVDEDHRIIRMSTRHWPRPFVPGAGEGYRDSAPHGQLRVVNPDPSRPSTPRKSSETASSFLRKQREALAGFVFTSPRPQSIARAGPSPLAHEVPTVAVVDPSLSRECIPTYAYTPSFRSYPSVTSLPIIRQYPPEDPFDTNRTDKQLPKLPYESSRNPPMEPAGGVTSKTWSNLGTLLHPFRSRSNTATSQPTTNVRGLSHFSVSTNGSRTSRRSDPFDLDRPSIRGSTPARSGHEFHRGGNSPGWILYEGT